MSVFRYKNSKVWTMDFLFHGQRIRESAGTRSKTLALKIEDKRRRALEEDVAGIKKRRQPLLLSVAADEWLEMKKATLAPRSLKIEQANLAHLLPELGRKLICDIEAREIARYQQNRLDEDASPKTVNLEVGTLRAILKRSGQWARLQPEVSMLPTRDDVGRPSQRTRKRHCYRLALNPAPALWFHSSPWRLRRAHGTEPFARSNGGTWILRIAA